MNVFIREMKAHWKSLIIWSIGILFLIASGMAKYSYYSESGQSISAIMSKMPKVLRYVFGFGDFDLTKVSGFYGMLFIYILIIATIHAVMLGANIIAKEEADRTVEFLLVKPVSRVKVVTAKLAASLTNILILNIVSLVLSIGIVQKYSNGEAIGKYMFLFAIVLFILQIMFLFIGTAIAAASNSPRKAASTATVVLLVAYILSIVADMNSNLEFLKYITPFKYFNIAGIIASGKLAIFPVELSLAIIVVLCCVTYVSYKRRDLRI